MQILDLRKKSKLSEYVFGIIVGTVFVFEVFVLLPVVAGY